mgnify:CR=1 FL=1
MKTTIIVIVLVILFVLIVGMILDNKSRKDRRKQMLKNIELLDKKNKNES